MANTWDYFTTLVNCPGAQQRVFDFFGDPGAISWQEADQDSLNKTWQQTLDWLKPFFSLSLLADTLLHRRNPFSPIPPWLSESATTTLPTDLTLDEAVRHSWCSVPVVVTQPGSTVILYFVVGAIAASNPQYKLYPDWAANLLDQDAQQAVSDAFRAALHLQVPTTTNVLLYTFPLTCPQGTLPPANGNARLLITGRSLGLSLGIGALSSLAQRTATKHWIATGDVQNDGAIYSIQSLNQKFKHIAGIKGKFTLFLYPLANTEPLPAEPKLVSKGVNDLRLAWLWTERCTLPSALAEMNRLEIALQSPADFLANCQGLTISALDDCRISGMDEQLTHWIQKQPQRMQQFVKSIEASLKGHQYDHAEMLGSFLCEKDITAIGARSPVPALAYCSSRLALANHSGDQSKGEQWYQLGRTFTDAAQKSMEGQKIYATFVNRRFGVAARHNRYDFAPALPQEFMSILAQQRKINVQCGACSDYALGSSLGTLAQNYAFCGTAYLEETRETIKMAMQAFGDGRDPDLQNDWLRQVSYLLFALTDAKKFTEAEEQLHRLLEKQPSEPFDLEPILTDGFKIFAIARFLADYTQSSKLPDHFIPLCKQLVGFIEKNMLPRQFNISAQIHPWQLVYWNIGRLARQQDSMPLAQQAWQLSLDLCRQGDETIRVMGLLPLASCCHAANGSCPDELNSEAKAILEEINTSRYLNKEHFQSLLNVSSYEALQLVHEHPEQYFPFTYR